MSSQKYYKQKQNTQLKFETHTYLYQLFDVTGLLIFSGLINDLMICFFTDLLHDSYFYCVYMEIQKVASWKNTFQNFVSHTFCVRVFSYFVKSSDILMCLCGSMHVKSGQIEIICFALKFYRPLYLSQSQLLQLL